MENSSLGNLNSVERNTSITNICAIQRKGLYVLCLLINTSELTRSSDSSSSSTCCLCSLATGVSVDETVLRSRRTLRGRDGGGASAMICILPLMLVTLPMCTFVELLIFTLPTVCMLLIELSRSRKVSRMMVPLLSPANRLFIGKYKYNCSVYIIDQHTS